MHASRSLCMGRHSLECQMGRALTAFNTSGIKVHVMLFLPPFLFVFVISQGNCNSGRDYCNVSVLNCTYRK